MKKQKVELMTEKVALATSLKESKMFSEQWIYENIYNMSHSDWEALHEQVIEDLKTDFRREQIVGEGNDPKKTNQSFGTPHDIASMHVSNKMDLPGVENNEAGPGRPKEPGTWGTHDSPFGRDPLGTKELHKTFKSDPRPVAT